MAQGRSRSGKLFFRLFLLSVIVGIAVFGYILVGTGTPEERAEGYFQRGQELVQSGETDSAILEFRNVFQHQPNHIEARVALADIYEERGNFNEAFGHLNWLAEKFPENIEIQKKALAVGLPLEVWGNLSTISAAILAKEPQDNDAVIASTVSNYVLSIVDKQVDRRNELGQKTIALLEDNPDHQLLLRTAADFAISQRRQLEALSYIDRGISLNPDNREFRRMRLNILSVLQDWNAVETELLELTTRFPDDESYPNTLVQFYFSRDRFDEVEETFRQMIATSEDSTLAVQRLVAFLAQHKGFDDAIAELDNQLPNAKDPVLLTAIRAGFVFQSGDQSSGVAALEKLIADNPEYEGLNRFKTSLGQMLLQADNVVGARALIEEVLADDPTNVQAVKVKSEWLISEDNSGEALNLLRSILSSEENDPQVFSLLSRAYTREGKPEIAAQMLSEAVTASNNAPQESLRYAQVLAREGDFIPAERTLIDSLRLNPNNPVLLGALGNIYIQLQDWSRAEQVLADLNRLGSEEAVRRAYQLRLNVLNAKNSTGEAVQFLQELAETSDVSVQAKVQLLRVYLSQQDTVAARQSIDELLADAPENPNFQFLDAVVQLAEGDIDGAEAKLRNVVGENPGFERAVLSLHRIYKSKGADEDAQLVLQNGIEANENAANLRWLMASQKEQTGDVEGAIAIYEEMYAKNSENLIVANNLASLLSNHRTDEPSIERAATIAKRLASFDNAAFNDTYGWILHLQGKHEEALTYLQKSADQIAQDPTVRFHLAEVLAALGNTEEARASYAQVLSLAGATTDQKIVDKASSMVSTLGQQDQN